MTQQNRETLLVQADPEALRNELIEALLNAVSRDYECGTFAGHPTDKYATELRARSAAEAFGLTLDTYVDRRIEAALRARATLDLDGEKA